MKIGLIRGRHPLPVESYLIDQDTVEFDQAHRIAYDAMTSLLKNIEKRTVIQLYITGLTRCTLGAIAAFNEEAKKNEGFRYGNDGCILEIWEFNSQIGEYKTVIKFKQTDYVRTDDYVWGCSSSELR
ncbi:hypothetical protein [Paenibacillus oleatilyticus]|uniref:hypothetical protein n=1 Tax=Paenibacillus oleatilyticus TaxID=2594886 RepID=UPI001C1F4BC7|nr:hypothetical protein [Paenibacillus oleatilyticus]MBU7316122.1 hypothetical protein [Paenibacillus oleatilyticus]